MHVAFFNWFPYLPVTLTGLKDKFNLHPRRDISDKLVIRVVYDTNAHSSTRVESFVLDKISRILRKITHKFTIDWASYDRVENEKIMKTLFIKNLIDLKNVNIIGGSLKSCSNSSRDAAPTNRAQEHIRKSKFSETVMDEQTLPLLSNDLPILDVLKSMECSFTSDGDSTDNNSL
jgi:hypothetical protein